MIPDFKTGIDYFIANKGVQVNTIVQDKCPRKLLFGEQIQILEGHPEEKNHLKVSYNFEGKKCEGCINKKDLKLTQNPPLEIYFLDVGQGDSILIVTPNNKKILIDGGRDKSAYELLCRKYSLGKNNNKIEFEAIYLTHADQDHADGLIPILESSDIKINKLYHNGIMKYKYDKKKVEIKTEEMTEIGPKVKAGSHEYLKRIKNNLFDFDREIALSARSRKLLDAITYGLRDNKSYRQLSKFRVRVKIRAVLKAFFNRDLMSHVISDEEKNRLERLDSDSGVKYEEKISIERSNKEGEIFPVEQKLEIRILGPIRPLPELAITI